MRKKTKFIINAFKILRVRLSNNVHKLWHMLPIDDLTKQKAKSAVFRSLSFIINGTEIYRRWENFSTQRGLNEIGLSDSLCLDRLRTALPFEIVTTKHTLYVAQLLKKILAEMGVSANISFGFLPKTDKGQMFFVICPQMFKRLPRYFVAFQMEQSVHTRWFTPDYFLLLKKACAVFDYSLTNIESLINNGVPFKQIFYMPISAFRDYDAYLRKTGYLSNDLEPEIDVLFYGDPNSERRQRFLGKIKSKFNLYIASEVFGRDLYPLMKSAKVIVNIHYYENALLETTRIYEALSMGVPVVSEISKDLCQYQGLENLVIFTEIGNVDCMILEIEKLLKSKCLREERKSAISDFVQEDNVFAQHLKRYFLSVGVLSLDNYLRELKITPEISCDIPKLCLTLPETPIRTRSFINQGKIDFKFVEGMRHAIGWVGCGLSYKCIAHELVLKASELAVICEDDVFFPPDFDQRLNHAIAYLKHDFFSWHIFVGMVAHLHPSTNILRIHEFKGIEYIYIDTMTSMVMNIYSPAGLDLIRQWNEKNEDPYTNTIDRYLERISGLVVVVTLPFLVGHSEEQESTLWGIANVQYRELIDQSEKLLADKVADYKSRSRYLTEVSAL